MPTYFVSDSRGDHGPYPPSQLPAQGVNAQTMVWCEGMPDWQPAGSIPELVPYLAPTSQSAAYSPSQSHATQDLSSLSQSYAGSVPSPRTKGGTGMGATSLIMGIAGLVCTVGSIVPLLGVCCFFGSFPIAIMAIIFGFISLKTPGRNMGIAGIITGGLSLIGSILIIIGAMVYAVAINHP